MINRVGRGDVVRLTSTGEVGTVKGWADHERLDQFGTIIDVEVSREKIVQVNGLALEFVALAKLKARPLAAWAVVLVCMGLSSLIAYKLSAAGVNDWFAGAVGGSLYASFDRVLSAVFLRPQRVKLHLPSKMYARPSSRPVSK